MTTRRIPVGSSLADVHAVRTQVRDLLQACGIVDTDLAELATSELVGNAIRHGEGPITVVVRCAGRRARIEVHDASPEPPSPKHVDPSEVGGRGLAIVEAFTANWGVDRTDGGKAVWFQVADPRPTVEANLLR